MFGDLPAKVVTKTAREGRRGGDILLCIGWLGRFTRLSKLQSVNGSWLG